MTWMDVAVQLRAQRIPGVLITVAAVRGHAPREAGARPEPPSDPEGSVELGDIAISFDTCQREAEQQRKPMADHVVHLLVHATLHLIGYDHEIDADAETMEQSERSILAHLGIPDPYQ